MRNRRLLPVFLAITLSLTVLMGFASSVDASQTGGMTPGEYFGIGNGRNGLIVVKVNVSADRIESVEVVSQDETHNTGSVPLRAYPDLIVEHQTLNVDIVSGATISSVAMLSAVLDAVTQAGGARAMFSSRLPAPEAPEDCAADIVVIGAGGAGMTAAIHAAKEGRNVILLEQLGIVGGTSNYTIESIAAVQSRVNVATGSTLDAVTQAANLVRGNPDGNPEAFEIFTANNGEMVDWLRTIGAPLNVTSGSSGATASREVGEVGVTVVSALKAETLRAGVDLRIDSRATELIVTDGVISGVKVSAKGGDYTISSGAVIMAVGGFGANNAMVTEYAPQYEGYDFSCTPGATGSGHLMAQAVGAELANMDYIRVNVSYSERDDGAFYYVNSLFANGGILVNDDGLRFITDGGGYGTGPAIVEIANGRGWAIFENSIVEGVRDVRKYGELGLYVSADTIGELADKIGVNRANLEKTIETYQGYVAAGADEEFNRNNPSMTFTNAPFYASRVICRVQGTFGGITTNLEAEVLTPEGEVIPGLFAAGECANDGTWGANPASVNLVFGRIAGQSAAAYVD